MAQLWYDFTVKYYVAIKTIVDQDGRHVIIKLKEQATKICILYLIFVL